MGNSILNVLCDEGIVYSDHIYLADSLFLELLIGRNVPGDVEITGIREGARDANL